MNKRIREKHERHGYNGKHGLHKEMKSLLKRLGLWSNCQSQRENGIKNRG